MLNNIPTSNVEGHPIQHSFLSERFISRVRVFKEILKEVDLAPLPEILDSFRRDATPERELEIWERIATTYLVYLAHNPTNDLAVKKDIFAVLLGTSMLKEDWGDIQHLTTDQIDFLVRHFRGW